MPFLILGLIMTGLGAFFTVRSAREEDREGLIGSVTLFAAGLVLTIIFGIFYRLILLRT